MNESSAARVADVTTEAVGGAPREERVRVAKIMRGGKLLYFGYMTDAEARRVEAAARAEYARTGRVEGARTARPVRGAVAHRDDAEMYERELAAERVQAPEVELMLAVLEEAKRVLASATARPGERLAAERWFASNDRSYLCAFATICDELGLNPIAARQELRR